MAINWSAYEAAKELYGTNKENITDIGSRFPLFARTVMAINDEHLLDILKALPKVTARVVESGLKDMDAEATDDTEQETKAAAADEAEEDETEEKDYSEMTAVELYKLCCKRGLSGKCKNRKKDSLIKILKEADGNTDAEDADDWGEGEEEKEEKEEKPKKDPYKGKTAKELFMLCKERGLKPEIKKTAQFYADLLKADDAKAAAAEEDTDDDWGEDEAEEVKPEKKTRGRKAKDAAKKAEKPTKKKVEKEEEDDWGDDSEDDSDDDWEI